MPKYKPSLGEITITTPHQSMKNYLIDELENTRQWNPQYITRLGNKFLFRSKATYNPLWLIEITETGLRCKSDQPIVSLRKGFRILMGSGKLELT